MRPGRRRVRHGADTNPLPSSSPRPPHLRLRSPARGSAGGLAPTGSPMRARWFAVAGPPRRPLRGQAAVAGGRPGLFTGGSRQETRKAPLTATQYGGGCRRLDFPPRCYGACARGGSMRTSHGKPLPSAPRRGGLRARDREEPRCERGSAGGLSARGTGGCVGREVRSTEGPGVRIHSGGGGLAPESSVGGRAGGGVLCPCWDQTQCDPSFLVYPDGSWHVWTPLT